MVPGLKDKIIKELPGLPDDVLVEIDNIINTFKDKTELKHPPGGLDAVFGKISEQDAEEMLKAIEDCERIDADGW